MLKGKVAVVTGGARGIGRQIALEYAKNHADVAVIASHESDSLNDTVSELCALGVNAKSYVCDIRDEKQTTIIAQCILKDFGNVDILVNNAGMNKDALLISMKKEELDNVIDTNLKGSIYITQAFIRNMMRNKKGSIINISSVVGLMGNTGQAAYSASKAGIIGFTKTIAKEYGRKNIRCNAIAPGFITTRMTDNLSEEQKNEMKKIIAIGRMGTPQDVAGLALFLASDNSSYITGEVIKVDGGMYI